MSGSSSTQLPRAGDIIDGKYVLERLLGQGGMGAVFGARHIKLGHAVAIKVMLADAANHEAAQRFVNEGRAAANIQNEHVVRVSDVDEENGYAYMVLELLEGEDLSQVLDRERRLPSHVAVGYVLQALEGVRQAHAQGIVHRDLKPSNLFLARRQNGGTVVKVLDFGISKASTPLGMAPGALTSTKAMLGSPLYMSPEQLRSSKSVDARADIWAMGVILFELITGTLPFTGENLGELFAQILETDAPLLRAHVADCPAGLEAIVGRCLQRRPEHRFQSVAELERELAPFLSAGSASLLAYGAAAAPSVTALLGPPHHPPTGGGPGANGPAGYGPPPSNGIGPPPGTYPGPARPGLGAAGSESGSGPYPQPVTGGVPFGAMTPEPHLARHPHQQTASAWQSTGSRSKGPGTGLLIGAGVALVAVVGIGLAGASAWRSRASDHASGGGAAASATASAVLPATAAVAAPVEASALPSSSGAPVAATANVDAGAAPAPLAAAPGKHRPAAAIAAKGEAAVAAPAKVEPAKVEPAKVEPAKAAARPPAGTLQGER